jgi:predicted nucleotidyltransferase
MAELEVDSAALAGICEQYGISRLDVFGSVSRGEADGSSDVDVLYDLAPGRHLTWDIELLVDDLSELFGRHVDLVSRRSLRPLIRASVEADAKALYAA